MSSKESPDIMYHLRKRPILILLLLSPGIPEYLSGSSPFNAIILNPPQFFLQVVLNLGLYGPGVVLIREAIVRWKKGWASVLVLGAAYGIFEEGVALSTLFNPLAGPVGKLGFYGHYLGVNWIWVSGILPVHMIYSISLPILLLNLVVPEMVGKSLVVSRKKISLLFVIFGVDALVLFLTVLRTEHFWMGWPVFIGSLVAIGILVIIAKQIRSDLVHAFSNFPKISPFKIGMVGALFYSSVLVVETVFGYRITASEDLIFVLLVETLFLFYVLKVIGQGNNARQVIAFAAGLMVPIALIGIISEAGFPLIFVVDFVLGFFFWKLWRGASGKAPLVFREH